MYDIYEEPRHLNIKKVVIIAVLFILIIVGIIFLIVHKTSDSNTNNENTSVSQNESTTVFSSDDNKISIELSNNFHLKKYDSDYLLELRSEDNLDIFIQNEEIVSNKDLIEVVEADKNTFLANFDSYSNLSDSKELSVNNNLAYTYSFHYLDKTLNKAFYLQVIWLQTNENYYVFDIEFPLDDLDFYTNLVSSALASFKVNT